MSNIEIHIEDSEGNTQALQLSADQNLMEVLRDAGLGVEGTCGGVCSCASCHVYIEDGFIDKMPAITDDEQAMLEAISGLVEVSAGSRLACQLIANDSWSSMRLKIAPDL